MDVRVYRRRGASAARGAGPSTRPLGRGARAANTYPPFAALVFVPGGAGAGVGVVEVALGRRQPAAARRGLPAVGAPGRRRATIGRGGGGPGGRARSGASRCTTSLLYGQINLALLAAGALGRDPAGRLAAARRRHRPGAPASRSPPGLLIVYLVLTGRWPRRGHGGRRPSLRHHRADRPLVDAGATWTLLDPAPVRLRSDRPAGERRQPVRARRGWSAPTTVGTPRRSRCCSIARACSSPDWLIAVLAHRRLGDAWGAARGRPDRPARLADLVEPPLGLVHPDPRGAVVPGAGLGDPDPASSSGRTSCGWCRTATPSSWTSTALEIARSGAYGSSPLRCSCALRRASRSRGRLASARCPARRCRCATA